VFRGLGLDLPVERFASGLSHTLQQFARRIPAGSDRFSFFPGGEDDYWQRFAKASAEHAAGHAVEAELVSRAVVELREFFATPRAWRVYPDSVPALEALKELGVRLGVVSNWDSRLPHVLRILDLADYFEVVGVSHLERTEKPSPEMFHRVMRSLDACPNETLHVGDVPELDLDGARLAGIDGLLIDRHGRLDASHRAIDNLTELARIADGVTH
jgi:putative hydrolase of the HAD superfamily